jgi:hypothetical protein
MTPREKAKDLYDSYWYCLFESNIEKRNYWSKQCALVAVDEIIKAIKIADNITFMYVIDYYKEVKHEIEKI